MEKLNDLTICAVKNGYSVTQRRSDFCTSEREHVFESQQSLFVWLKKNLVDPNAKPKPEKAAKK